MTQQHTGTFFDTWFERYATLFEVDAQGLPDAAKVRLLLRKLNNTCHDQYLNTILPSKPTDFTFAQTAEKLTEIFGKKTTIFNTRYTCLTLSKHSNEDFRAYAARVNKQCEEAKIGQITADQFKCLMFVCGLNTDIEIRTKLLSLMDRPDKQDLTLHNLITETQRLVNLKQDVAMVIAPDAQTPPICAISNQKSKQQTQAPQFGSSNHHNPVTQTKDTMLVLRSHALFT